MQIPLLNGLKQRGYDYSISEENTFEDSHDYYVMRISTEAPTQDFLLDARERLFWVQDITLILRTVFIEQLRQQRRKERPANSDVVAQAE